MKKIYEKPTMGIVNIKAECMLDASRTVQISTTHFNGDNTTIEARERVGIFSAPDNGYDRSLW